MACFISLSASLSPLDCMHHQTFDMVYENVDSNFKVAFARVVVEARKKELLPPPLNLISAIISVLYDLCERGFASDFCRCFQCVLIAL